MKQADHQNQIREAVEHIGGIKGNIPQHRRESRREYSFSGLPFAEQLAIWDQLWGHENNFRVRLHAFFFLERHIKNKAALPEMWPVIVRWQEQVDDWGLCDALAKIYTKIMAVAPDDVYAQLEKWNTHPNPWMRRQSVVSLLYYSRTKKQYPSFTQIEALITPLLHDKEYYVQKGVGWTLREMHTVYPDETFTWLKIHIKQISSIAFTIAIEKMEAVKTGELKGLRKAGAPRND
jgi:3-methyladenine DNA glycosylase AlkD